MIGTAIDKHQKKNGKITIIKTLYKLTKKKPFGVKYTHTPENQLELFSVFVWTYRYLILSAKVLLFVLFTIILAQPFKINSTETPLNHKEYGIDLIFVLDVSLSMQAMDLQPNRLESAKNVISNFVKQRNGDRIGLVVYSGEAYTVCHKTTDYQLLISQLNQVDGNDLIQGTAIGVGLGTGVTQLRGDSTSSKAIILLTDGKNNVGDIAPLEAAELAINEGVRVYTIGVGTNGYAPMPDMGGFSSGIVYSQVEIDEEILQSISEKTGAKYFRATDSKSLKNIISEIDTIEKKLVNQNQPAVPITTAPEVFLYTLVFFVSLVLISDIFLFVNYE